MEEYRAYVIGPDGHIFNRVDIRCSDEKEARRLAKIGVDGHAVELWQADHFIERFEPEQQGRLKGSPTHNPIRGRTE
jgi:hypothetical protein